MHTLLDVNATAAALTATIFLLRLLLLLASSSSFVLNVGSLRDCTMLCAEL